MEIAENVHRCSMGKILIKFLILFPLWIFSEAWNQPIGLGAFVFAYVLLGAMRAYDNHERPLVGIVHHILALLFSLFIEFATLSTWSVFLVFLGSALSFALIYLIGTRRYFWKLVGWIPIAFLLSYLTELLSKTSRLFVTNFISVFCFVALATIAYEALVDGLSLLLRKLRSMGSKE